MHQNHLACFGTRDSSVKGIQKQEMSANRKLPRKIDGVRNRVSSRPQR